MNVSPRRRRRNTREHTLIIRKTERILFLTFGAAYAENRKGEIIMNIQEKIEREERRINSDNEILDNLRKYRLSDESGRLAVEIYYEMDGLKKDVLKHQKVLEKLRPAV